MEHDLKEMLKKANKGGYAIPAFNFNDVWDLTAVVEAAEEERAPVIVMAFHRVLTTLHPEVCGAMGIGAIKMASVPVALHLDHSEDVGLCKLAVDNGFSAVMIDGSKLPLEENIAKVRDVVEYAHARGSIVEAELGKIKGKDFEGTFGGGDFLVQVDDAVKLVNETGVDMLAVGIGTAHGFYEGKPEINFKRLEEVNKAVDIPLVLHGGTGIPEEDIHRAIKLGISKVNIGTILRHTYITTLKEEFDRYKPGSHILDIMKAAREKIKAQARICIKACMADGKA
jgi:ketose-bisphosphate aldolase